MNEGKSCIFPSELLINTSGNDLHCCVISPTVLNRLHTDVEKTDIWIDSELGIFQVSVREKP